MSDEAGDEIDALLKDVGADVDWPDTEASTAVRDELAAVPELGRLADLAEWLRGVRPATSAIERASVLIVAADVAEPTAEAAAVASIRVRTVPVEETGTPVAAGVAIADDEAERGTELVIVALPGLGVDTAAAVSVLADTEPVKVLPRGVAACDPADWMAAAVTVRDWRRRAMAHRDDPDGLLAEIGSARLAVGAGLLLQLAVRRTPVLLDGSGAATAALIAYEAQPKAARWWYAVDNGTDPLEEIAHNRMGLAPLLGLGTSLGTGLAGVLAVPAVRAAARLHTV